MGRVKASVHENRQTRAVVGFHPPEKRTSRVVRKNNNTIQTTISEWIMDDDDPHSQLTHDHSNNEHIQPTTPSTSHPLTANTTHL